MEEILTFGACTVKKELRIKDSFRKIVVVGDPQPMYTDESGITYVGLMSFMLDKSILETLG